MSAAHIIRRAGFEDVEQIFALIKSFPEQLLARPISDIVQNVDRFLVCEEDGRVAGAVSWQILPEMGRPKTPTVELKSLAVAVERQRQGIGEALVRAALDHILAMHPCQVIALTFAPGFFRRFGFEETSKEGLMHKLYAGCVNCTKYDSPFTCPEIAMMYTPAVAVE